MLPKVLPVDYTQRALTYGCMLGAGARGPLVAGNFDTGENVEVNVGDDEPKGVVFRTYSMVGLGQAGFQPTDVLEARDVPLRGQLLWDKVHGCYRIITPGG